MKKDIVIIKCQECGEDFLYEFNGRGKKPIYCKDCREKKVLEAKQKYRDKQKELNQITDESLENNSTNINFDKQDYIQRVIQFANDIDQLRVNLCEFSKELAYYQSNHDRNDQLFMHRIENIDVDNLSQLQTFMKDFKQTRNKRRDVKDIILIVSDLIDALPYRCYSTVMRKIRCTKPAEK